MSIRAAGCIFLCKSTKRILLNFRSENSNKPNCFGFWGGKLDKEENILEGLSREVVEELGFVPNYERIIILDEFTSPDNFFKYYSFVVIVSEEFIPKINEESQGYCWCGFANYPKPLHPGARAILENEMVTKSLTRLLESDTGSNFPTNIVTKSEETEE
jgi:8-oxo-dGTP pyrophosphatase MutT (NUDIX family)